jgi:hypothetical protein
MCAMSRAEPPLLPHQPAPAPEANRLEYRRLRAPREDRQVLAIPPLNQVAALLAREGQPTVAAARDRRCEYELQGRSICDLANAARRELLAAATNYTRSYREVASGESAGKIFLAGHQPQLFHPGVWFKNFALARLAREQGATAVNLVIDSDTLKQTALRVPGGSIAQPRTRMIAFDAAGPEVLYARRQIDDRSLFASFGSRAGEWLRPLVPDPLLNRFWPLAVARAGETSNLGECLAQARHQLEGEWGTETLELPQSQVCRMESFYWFAAHLLAHLPRFAQIYNGVVADYRHLHGIRGANHPVPDLATDGPWLEAPFWLVSDDRADRRRVFARRRGDEILVSDRLGFDVALPLTADGDGGRAVEALVAWSSRGARLLTRALTTTLFARMFLGDLFLHGIGGGKYDQLTDELVRRFFGVEPPPFMVLSATLLLPVAHERVTAEDARGVDHLLREVEFHPERHVERASLSAANALAFDTALAAKRRWIEAAQTRDNARERCHGIRAANASLAQWVSPLRAALLAKREDYAQRLRAESVLGWREYAFCFYPEADLREFLQAATR